MKPPTRKQMLAENQTLRAICKEFHWMARRYSHGRSSVAAGLFNDLTQKLLELGVELKAGVIDGTIWAQDGGGRTFDGLTEMQCTPESESAVGQFIVPPRVKVCEALEKILGSNEPDKAYLRMCQLVDAAKAMLDNEPCRLDHHGNCQAHNLGNPCEQKRLRDVLAMCGEVP